MIQVVLGVLGVLLILCLGLLGLVFGFMGLTLFAGVGWAVAAALLFVVLRVTLPFTFGVFYYVWQGLGLHWSIAAVVALPGLVVVVPSLVAGVVQFALSLLPRRA